MNRSQVILSILLLSLAVNLIFIGGIAYRASNFRGMAPRPFPPNISWTVRDLSEARQTELAPMLEQSNEQIRPMRAEMFTSQRRVNELMASDSFDAEALNQAFNELRAASNRYQQLSHQQTITLLSELSEEERRTAQEFVQRRGPRGDRDGRRGRGGPDGRPFAGGTGGPGGPGARPPPQDY